MISAVDRGARSWTPLILAALAALTCCWPPGIAPAGEIPGASLQALVVVTADWPSTDGEMRLYERTSAGSPWFPRGEAIPCVVGRNGLAWGRGIHPEPAGEPRKREGDGRAPAGIFQLGPAFGYGPAESLPGIAMAYRQVGGQSRCVDDVASVYYNRLVEEGNGFKDWTSSEEMRRTDEQYRLGLVIGHNADPVVPGGGSCIFLHSWERPFKGTSGCTALSAPDLEGLLRRLRSRDRPLLIQLPRQVYERLALPWGLP
jgi:D-alanyl-D-alanine dipeptidase